jgi:hypothetical protein
MSALTRKLINDGLAPARQHMTDAQALAERCEQACQSGRTTSERRRVLAEAAAFIRAQYGLPARAGERAA